MEDIKEKIARLKEKGALEIGKGNWERALRNFMEILKESPDDLHALMRAGDAYAKLGKNDEACRVYDRLVGLYAKEGFLIKAIAVHRLILKIKPDFPDGEIRLLLLSEQKNRQDVLPGIKRGETKKTRADFPRPPLFSDLTQDEFTAVTEKLIPLSVAAGGMIIREGDVGNSIYIIVSGRVSIFKSDADQNEVWITNLDEGSFFGEFGYFSGEKRSASVKALTDCTLLEIGKKDVGSIVKKHPRVNEVLRKFYKERVLDTLLAVSPLFSALPPEGRAQLMSAVVFSTHKTGERIVREGEEGDRMYVIISGEVGVTTQKEGAVVTLARLRSGDFFGEVSVITGKPRTATVTALSDTDLAQIPKPAVQQQMRRYPEIEERLAHYIQMRVENTISTIMQFKNRKIESGMI